MCLLYGVLPILSTDKKTEIIKIDRLYDGGVLLAWGGSTSIGNPITTTRVGLRIINSVTKLGYVSM